MSVRFLFIKYNYIHTVFGTDNYMTNEVFQVVLYI